MGQDSFEAVSLGGSITDPHFVKFQIASEDKILAWAFAIREREEMQCILILFLWQWFDNRNGLAFLLMCILKEKTAK